MTPAAAAVPARRQPVERPAFVRISDHIAVASAREALLVQLSGVLDAEVAEKLRTVLHAPLADEQREILVAAGGVVGVDITVLAALIDAANWQRRHGRRLVLVSMSDGLRLAAEAARLLARLPAAD